MDSTLSGLSVIVGTRSLDRRLDQAGWHLPVVEAEIVEEPPREHVGGRPGTPVTVRHRAALPTPKPSVPAPTYGPDAGLRFTSRIPSGILIHSVA